MAKITQQDIDALRERADIVEIISGYTNLKKSGTHAFKGLCPFHSEKTPSFSVDRARNLFHCFGCQRGGDVYGFVQEAENLPFPEAAEWIARKVGFDLHYEEMSPGQKKAAGEKLRIIKANEAAAEFFHKALMDSPEAAEARRYLGSRGFGPEIATRWKLGYAPGRDSVTKHLLGRGFTADELIKADLARKSDRDGNLYDTFRQRIIFPTWNLQGDVVAFGARAVKADQQPKYLNSSETPVFSKSRMMFGLDRAKSIIAREGIATVVEGYTDVIALHEAGVTSAVATNGTALGETHFELLKKFGERVALMMDADTAGLKAAERSFDIHHRIGIEVLVAPLPAGRDPADVAAEDGQEGIKKVLDAARPLLEFKLDQLLSTLRLDTPEARAKAVREVAVVLGFHPDPIARHQYAAMAAERIGVDPEGIQRVLSEELSHASQRARGEQAAAPERRVPGHVKVEREALQLLLTKPQEVMRLVEGVDASHFSAPARRELFEFAHSGADHATAGQQLSADALALFTELVVGSEPLSLDEAGAREVFDRLRVFALERELKRRRETLQEVNPLEEPQRYDGLFTELVGLEAQRRDLLKRVQGET